MISRLSVSHLLWMDRLLFKQVTCAWYRKSVCMYTKGRARPNAHHVITSHGSVCVRGLQLGWVGLVFLFLILPVDFILPYKKYTNPEKGNVAVPPWCRSVDVATERESEDMLNYGKGEIRRSGLDGTVAGSVWKKLLWAEAQQLSVSVFWEIKIWSFSLVAWKQKPW